MKILHLEYFIAIVRFNSFTKAAQYLHISQPSLTAMIKKMEDQLGYQLLTRTTKDIKITEKGIQFYQYAVPLVNEYHQTIEKMFDLNTNQQPKLKISVLESTTQWLSTMIQQHATTHETPRYQIVETHDQSLSTSQLLNYHVDIALTNDKIKHEDIMSKRLYKESYILITPEGNFTNQKSTSLKDMPLIVPNKGSQVRKHLDDYFNRMTFHPNITAETDRFETAVNLVHKGIGYAVIPQIYYQSFNTTGLEAVQIRPKLSRTIYINYLKKRKHPTQVLSLIDQCLQYWNFKT